MKARFYVKISVEGLVEKTYTSPSKISHRYLGDGYEIHVIGTFKQSGFTRSRLDGAVMHFAKSKGYTVRSLRHEQ